MLFSVWVVTPCIPVSKKNTIFTFRAEDSWYLITSLYGATTQKNNIFILAAVIISNITEEGLFE
jgi:hypothetical protein